MGIIGMGQYQSHIKSVMTSMIGALTSLVFTGTLHAAMPYGEDPAELAPATAEEPIPSAVIVRRSARSAPAPSFNAPSPTVRDEALSAAWLETPDLFNSTTRVADVAGEGWEAAVRQEREDFANCLETRSCGSYVTQWQPIVEQARDDNRFAALQRINNAVNQQLRYRSDLIQYDQSDYWMTAEGFLTNSTGDCEDYALAKLWLLAAAGIDPSDMFIMVVQDTIVRLPHAFLAVRMGPSFVILDNRTNRILLPEDIDGIIPVITVGAEETFVHRRSLRQVSRPVRIAQSQSSEDLS